MTGQEDRWNEKYLQRTPSLFQPEEFLTERRHVLHPGTVLDIACGDGRHSLFLARHGFSVTGIDFSEQGLLRLTTFADQAGLHVNTYHRDLDTEDVLADLGLFDNIIVIHFKPQQSTFIEMVDALSPNGILLMTSFNMRQHTYRNFPKAFCYTEAEYVNLTESLELIEYVSYESDRAYQDGYVFRKRASAVGSST